MAVSGVPWNPDDEDFKKVTKMVGGNVNRIAKAFKVDRCTAYKLIRERPHLKAYIDEIRHGYDEELIEAAEDTLAFALTKRDSDLANALKSCFFILNNKGQHRGYSGKNNPNNNDRSNVQEFLSTLKSIARVGEVLSPNENASQPKVEDGEPILDKEQARSEGEIHAELGAKRIIGEFSP